MQCYIPSNLQDYYLCHFTPMVYVAMLQKAMLENDYEDHTQDLGWYHSFMQKQERANRISASMSKPARASLNAIEVGQDDDEETLTHSLCLEYTDELMYQRALDILN